MVKKQLKAENRNLVGRKVKQLRKQGKAPANIYGNKVKSHAIQVDLKEFETLYKEVGQTGLFDIVVGEVSKPVLIHEVQLNPKTGEVLHIDFMQVNLKVKVSASVPVELVGESPAEKQGLGVVVQQLNEIEIEALPTDLPEKFEINIENLAEVDQAIYVKDIKVDAGKIEFKVDPELIVAKVEAPQKEEEVLTPIVPVGAEGEVVAETEKAEGEAENKDNSKTE